VKVADKPTSPLSNASNHFVLRGIERL